MGKTVLTVEDRSLSGSGFHFQTEKNGGVLDSCGSIIADTRRLEKQRKRP